MLPNNAKVQVQYNYNTAAVQEFFLVLQCGPLQYNDAIQVFYNLQKTCRLAAVVRTWKNLYCSCIALVRTAAIQENFIFVLCYCSYIVVVLHLCGPLNHSAIPLPSNRVRRARDVSSFPLVSGSTDFRSKTSTRRHQTVGQAQHHWSSSDRWGCTCSICSTTKRRWSAAHSCRARRFGLPGRCRRQTSRTGNRCVLTMSLRPRRHRSAVVRCTRLYTAGSRQPHLWRETARSRQCASSRSSRSDWRAVSIDPD